MIYELIEPNPCPAWVRLLLGEEEEEYILYLSSTMSCYKTKYTDNLLITEYVFRSVMEINPVWNYHAMIRNT